MMLAAVLALAVQEPLLPVRTWKPNAKERYLVVAESQDKLGQARTEFRFELQVPKRLPTGEAVAIDATFRDLKVTMGKIERQKKGPVGAAVLTFRPTGLPEGLVAKGPVAVYLLPLMAFHLPKAASDGSWTLAQTLLDDKSRIEGKGVALREKAEWRIDGDYNLTTEKEAIGTMKMTSFFDREARLVRADGTFRGDEGSFNFTVRRG